MRRLPALIFFVGIALSGHAQEVQTYVESVPRMARPADSGKSEFLSQAGAGVSADYRRAVQILSAQVAQQPGNAELRYFLGYALNRANADGGEHIPETDLLQTTRASEQFEAVNRLQPTYTGEVVVLDPYSKITAIWGSQAMAYEVQQKPDSAAWAYREGQRRGGFLPSVLHYGRQALDECPRNAILIVNGDIQTFPLWYLQRVERRRTDVAVVNASLLHTAWYGKFLKRAGTVRLEASEAWIDTAQYVFWEPQTAEISDPAGGSPFRWRLGPTYLGRVLLKGDLLMLDLLKQNLFSRPVYFALGAEADTAINLHLGDWMRWDGLASRLDVREEMPLPDAARLAPYNSKGLSGAELRRSSGAAVVVGAYRHAYHMVIRGLRLGGRYTEAQRLFKKLEREFPEAALPFMSEENRQFHTRLKAIVQRDYDAQRSGQ